MEVSQLSTKGCHRLNTSSPSVFSICHIWCKKSVSKKIRGRDAQKEGLLAKPERLNYLLLSQIMQKYDRQMLGPLTISCQTVINNQVIGMVSFYFGWCFKFSGSLVTLPTGFRNSLVYQMFLLIKLSSNPKVSVLLGASLKNHAIHVCHCDIWWHPTLPIPDVFVIVLTGVGQLGEHAMAGKQLIPDQLSRIFLACENHAGISKIHILNYEWQFSLQVSIQLETPFPVYSGSIWV